MEKSVQSIDIPPTAELNRVRVLGWRKYFVQVTVLGYMMGYVLNFMFSQQFVYARILDNILAENNVTLNDTNSNSYCNSGSVNNTSGFLTEQAQAISSSWQLYLTLIAGIPSVFAAIFLGSFSDRVGRKVLFILPAAGVLIKSVLYCLASFLNLPLFYLLIAHGLEGCTGSFVTILLASFAYTSDITGRSNKRSLQILIMETMFGFALGIANISLGFMINAWGFNLPNLPIVGVNLLTLFIAIFLLPETRIKNINTPRLSIGQAVYRVFRFYISAKNDNPRGSFLICIVIFALGSATVVAVGSVLVLFVLNEPLCWNSIQIGYFNTATTISQAIAAVVVVKLLQFCLSDIGIGVVSGMTKVLSLVLLGLAKTDAYMYASAVVGMSGIAVVSMVRSIMSKMTPPDQLGAMFASIACVEAIMNMSATIIFLAIYQQTLGFYDGTVFFCMALMVTTSIVLYGVLHIKVRGRDKDRIQREESCVVNDERKPLLGEKHSKVY